MVQMATFSGMDELTRRSHMQRTLSGDDADARHATKSATYDALILDARFRQSLVAIRSLGKRGLRVAAVDSFPGSPAFASRWCFHRFVAPEYSSMSQPYLAYIEQLLDRSPTRALIPAADGTIELLRDARQRLESRVSLALANEAALEIAVNKEKTLAIAKSLGLHVPRGVTLHDARDTRMAIREIGLPVVIKPIESWLPIKEGGVRVASQLAVTEDEAIQAVEDLTYSGGAVLVQQFLPGRREAVSLLYANGTVYARFAQWAKRMEPPLGGASVMRQSIEIPPDSGEHTERLVRAIGLDGYSEVEFRRGADGAPYLMEINPRLSASVEIAVRSGVDFPSLVYQWASGERIEQVTGYRTGLWMRYLSGDLRTTIDTVRQRGRPGLPPPRQAIVDFCAAFFQNAHYDYLERGDQMPACVATLGFARHLLAKYAHIGSDSEGA